MMGERQTDQAALFYEFSLERRVPADHMLRAIDRFVDMKARGACGTVLQLHRPTLD
jgi:hypothetical protein